MEVLVAGGHGQVALRLLKLLVEHGHRGRGLIRNPAHAADLEAAGAEPVLCDLEADDPRPHLGSAQAIVFAAGAGPGSGAARKLTVDRDGAVRLLAAARAAEVPRFVIVSSVGAEAPPEGDDVFSVYLRAKAEADAAVRESDRAWTVVRPGGLTDDPGTGRVRIDTEPFRGAVSRDDVAAVLAAVVVEPRAAGATLYVNGGDVAVDEALAALAG
jgi:nucleoside-diphosphate-sugar epimerase